MKEEFNGIIDGREVKTIVKVKDKIKQWFAKSKDRNVSTPHFEERNNNLNVHQDSADNTQYRTMQNTSFIGSITLPSGLTFIPFNGDIAVLPMTIDNNNYRINHSTSGAEVILSASGSAVLVAKGEWGNWNPK